MAFSLLLFHMQYNREGLQGDSLPYRFRSRGRENKKSLKMLSNTGWKATHLVKWKRLKFAIFSEGFRGIFMA